MSAFTYLRWRRGLINKTTKTLWNVWRCVTSKSPRNTISNLSSNCCDSRDGFDSHHPLCLEVSGKLAILHCHCLRTSGLNWLHTWMMCLLYVTRTLRGDKVIMLTHTYPNKPLRKIKVAVCIYQADSPL